MFSSLLLSQFQTLQKMGESLNNPNMLDQIQYGLSAEEVAAVRASQGHASPKLTPAELAALKQSRGILTDVKRRQQQMSIAEGSEDGRDSAAERRGGSGAATPAAAGPEVENGEQHETVACQTQDGVEEEEVGETEGGDVF